jgi:CTP synthase
VITAVDVDDIYKIPAVLQGQGLDDLVIDHFGMQAPEADISAWSEVVAARASQDVEVTIAMVGKYVDLADAYKSVNEALTHAGLHTRTRVSIDYIDSEKIEREGAQVLDNVDGILVPGGFGERGIEGKIMAAGYAREHGLPYLGICLGMQVAAIEYARNVAGLAGAHSTEFQPAAEHPVIALVTEWHDPDGGVQTRTEESALGGTMRLGEQVCRLAESSRSLGLYQMEEIRERHRHRYEFNNLYRDRLSGAGLLFAGFSVEDDLVEIIELPEHPFYVACQFHPEFTSTPRTGHPLFIGFIDAARNRKAA